jgi:hypothetical protein
MVKDQQVRKLMKLIQSDMTLVVAAAKAGMDEKTARKYRELEKLPSQSQKERTWLTRPNPFAEVLSEVVGDARVLGRSAARYYPILVYFYSR